MADEKLFIEFRDRFLAEHGLTHESLTAKLVANQESDLAKEWRRELRQNSKHWCFECKIMHLPTAEHPSCDLCDAVHSPRPEGIFILHRGWKFTPPFICMGCGIEVCFIQWAFSRSCGPCDVSHSSTRRLLYELCFSGPREQVGQPTDAAFIPESHFVDPADKGKYTVIKD